MYACGAFLFIPAANAGSFLFFRTALFVLACGLATLETVAHPFVTALGPFNSSERRLNFAQGFNGLGGITGSMLGGYLILRTGIEQESNLDSVKWLYSAIGMVILLVALAFSFVKIPWQLDKPGSNLYVNAVNGDDTQGNSFQGKKLSQHRHFVWAILANFSCVAIQGGTWAYFINYGVETIHLSGETAAYYFGLSMVLKMAGRFLGVWLMKYLPPNILLAVFAFGGLCMCLLVAQSWGWTSFVALIMLNFFFSIIIPTTYGLGLKDLGVHKQRASSFIVLGVAGGAVFPPLMGLIANHNIAQAYYLPILFYIFLILFALKLSRIS